MGKPVIWCFRGPALLKQKSACSLGCSTENKIFGRETKSAQVLSGPQMLLAEQEGQGSKLA